MPHKRALTTSSTNAPQISSSPWRCSDHDRLHRDTRPCTDAPPSSPIIDTPAKKLRVEMKRTAAAVASRQHQLYPHSQATEPMFSRYSMKSPVFTQGRRGAVSFSLFDSHVPVPVPGALSPIVFISTPPPANSDLVSFEESSTDNDDDDDDDALRTTQLTAEALNSPSHSLVPETPLGLGVDMPSSPPQPLTENNLSTFNEQMAHSSTSPSQNANQMANNPLSSTPTASAMPSEIRHRISRLMLRTRINSLHQTAAQTQLELAKERLAGAHALVRLEASARKNWRHAAQLLLVICLAYAVWSAYNSVEMAYIEERRRLWFGLNSRARQIVEQRSSFTLNAR